MTLNVASLNELADHFNQKLSGLRMAVEIREAVLDEDDVVVGDLKIIERDLKALDVIMASMRTEVIRQKEELQTAENLQLSMKALNDQLDHMCCNIPARLPKPHRETPTSSLGTGEASVHDCHPAMKSKPSSATVHGPEKTKKRLRGEASIQQVEYLTTEDFQEIPKYMKGRITYNQINSAIDDLNKVVKSKYKIMLQKKTTLNDVNKKRYEGYKLQENKDTEGQYFIVNGDISDFSTLQMNSVTRSILTILRHFSRIKEIRGGKLTRYAVCTNMY